MTKLRAVLPIDLSTWDLDDDSAGLILNAALRGAALEGARQVLQIAIDEKARIDFPWEWGDSDGRKNARPSHPMIAYVELPLGFDQYEGALWAVDLREVISEMIELHEGPGTGKVIDDNSRKLLAEIAGGFRELAATLEQAIAPADAADPEPQPPVSKPPVSDADKPRR